MPRVDERREEGIKDEKRNEKHYMSRFMYGLSIQRAPGMSPRYEAESRKGRVK